MQENIRREQRCFTDSMYSVIWQDQGGHTRSLRVRGLDVSRSGLRIESAEEWQPGALLFIQAEKYELAGTATVRHCTRHGDYYRVGLEFSGEMKESAKLPADDALDYYEVLQISPNAEAETIHRVYRIMAARFHPDNPETGDHDRFLALKRAYHAVADPEKRAAYDARRREKETEPLSVFELKEFVDGVEGELNRRLGVLSILYNHRRLREEHPGVSLLDLERRMSFPREYLHFTMWYLRRKGYATVEDNSDYVLTAEGVDYVEANCSTSPILTKLLTGYHHVRGSDAATEQASAARTGRPARPLLTVSA